MIIEIVGPAGAGKTALTRALCQRESRFVPGRRLSTTAPLHIPFVLLHGLAVLPALIVRLRKGRWLTRDEFKQIIYLRGWHRVLQRQVSHPERAILLDQGPVHYLTTLHAFGPEQLRSGVFEAWWNAMFRRWGSLLDAIVWLDAEDDVLIDRIRARSKLHVVKHESRHKAVTFLQEYRAGFQYVVPRMSSEVGVEVLRYDTNREPLEEVASRLVDRLHSDDGARQGG